MTEADLQAIRQRCDAATPGPWRFNSYCSVHSPALRAEREVFLRDWHTAGEPSLTRQPGIENEWAERYYKADTLICRVPPHHGDTATGRHGADAAFIAHARTDLPRLLAAHRELLASYRALAEKYEQKCNAGIPD